MPKRIELLDSEPVRKEACDRCTTPFTPKGDQLQIPPAASAEILHHTVWRTWLLIAYSDERQLYYKFLLSRWYIFPLKCWENVIFELRSERATQNTVYSKNIQPIWGSNIHQLLHITSQYFCSFVITVIKTLARQTDHGQIRPAQELLDIVYLFLFVSLVLPLASCDFPQQSVFPVVGTDDTEDSGQVQQVVALGLAGFVHIMPSILEVNLQQVQPKWQWLFSTMLPGICNRSLVPINVNWYLTIIRRSGGE